MSRAASASDPACPSRKIIVPTIDRTIRHRKAFADIWYTRSPPSLQKDESCTKRNFETLLSFADAKAE